MYTDKKLRLTLFNEGAKAVSNFSNCAVRLRIFTNRPPPIVIITNAESSRPNLPNFIADTTSFTLQIVRLYFSVLHYHLTSLLKRKAPYSNHFGLVMWEINF